MAHADPRDPEAEHRDDDAEEGRLADGAAPGDEGAGLPPEGDDPMDGAAPSG